MVMQDSARSVTSPGHGGFTPRWSAPEVLTDATYSKESDIFSFAMVMVEVCCKPPTRVGPLFIVILH